MEGSSHIGWVDVNNTLAEVGEGLGGGGVPEDRVGVGVVQEGGWCSSEADSVCS